jgi:hypothetical protein
LGDWGTYFSETATVVDILLLLGRGFLAKTGVGSLPLLLFALLGEVYFVLGNETGANGAV